MKRIIISDTHIGSSFYRSDELLHFLHSQEFDQLILAGDIIDFIKVPTFTQNCAEILVEIAHRSNVIYIVGNHDESLEQWVGTMQLGIKFVKKYEFEEEGRTFRIEHGDRFFTGFLSATTFIKVLSVFQDLLERWLGVDLTSWWVNRQIKKHKLRSISKILSVNEDVDVFIMGHTHIPEVVIWVQPDQTIKTYVNSGDWVTHMTYVEITDGRVRLREYEQEDACDAGY
jgi:UDP-2,3-diacylglucosamine pyrophosphatase LpxH|tara:strand:+ start:801 stop:1484 length:684 start_codon:yes stop_codon:yes gene_type:complete